MGHRLTVFVLARPVDELPLSNEPIPCDLVRKHAARIGAAGEPTVADGYIPHEEMRVLETAGGPLPAPLMRGLLADRHRPDLDSLARETDPERFVRRILPHAARSFAASIALLPREHARATAVAYLYCRMLDTYEDLHPDPAGLLDLFASRLEQDPPAPAAALDDRLARDDRDRVHLLLVRRSGLVDEVFTTLPDEVRSSIAALVRSLADGMIWSTAAFARQGGVLVDEDQLARYCRNVIGHPAVFVLDLITSEELSDSAREDAFLVSEMIQLANVTRDIEADLARGVGYHPALKPYLGAAQLQPGGRAKVSEVRRELVALALGRVAAYRRLFEGLGLGRSAGVRGAAVMMLLFTDLHYRGCAERSGQVAWPGPRGRLEVVARSLPALVSPRWASHTVRRVERDFLGACSLPAPRLV